MHFWNWLFHPDFKTENLERRRQMHLLSSSLLVLMTLGVLLTIIPSVIDPVSYPLDDPTNFIAVAGILFLAVCYSVNRRGYYLAAAYTTLIGIILTIFAATFIDGPDGYGFLNYLIIPVIFGSMLLPFWANGALIIACTLTMLCIALVFDQPNMYAVPVLFFATISSLILLIMRHRDAVEHDRRAVLEESEERFRRLFLEAPIGMAIVDRNERFIRVNTLLCTMLGYSAADMEHIRLRDILHPEDQQNDSSLTTQRSRFRIEKRCITQQGNILTVNITASMIMERNVYYGLLMIEDVTEYKLMEQDARQADRLMLELSKQRELSDFKARFLSSVSHEFRTPLTALLSSAELIERYHDRLSPESRSEGFKRIYAEVTRLNHMVDDLLEISRGDSSQIKFKPNPIDLISFCDGLVRELQTSIGSQHQIVFTHTGSIDHFSADTHLLRGMLSNLILNGIKYTPEGGVVQLNVRCESSRVVMTITDEGIGIPEDDQAQIFDPFYRGSNVGTIKGTGLGLKIVKDYVSLHCGTITLSSEQGEGTIFTITLPAN